MLKTAQIRKVFQQQAQSKHGPKLAAIDVREFSRLTGIVNYFCVCLALSFTSRLLLDTLLFLSDGEADRWFPVNDWRLGYLIRSEQRLLKDRTVKILKDQEGRFTILGGRKVTEQALCKWIARHRKALVNEMDAAGITLVEVKKGGHKRGENLPHEYRLPLVALIQDVQFQLENALGLDDPRQEIVEKEIWKAVLAVCEQERKLVQRKPITERFRKPRETPEKYIHLSVAYYKKALDLCGAAAQFERIATFAENEFSTAYVARAKMKGII